MLSLLEGKPCPQDVSGGVHVRVSLVTTGHAAECRLADAVARSGVPALGAPLRGAAGGGRGHRPPRPLTRRGAHPPEAPPPPPRHPPLHPSLRPPPCRLAS